MRATLAHPAQKRLYAQCAHVARYPFGGQCQGIEEMRQAHQVVVALHRVPGMRKGMFVVVALALFDQEAGLDTPTLAGARVTALVDVVGVQTLARQPHVLGLLSDKLATRRVDLLPGFFTAHYMHKEAFAVPLIAIGDVVDPPELLLTPVPVLVFTVMGQARLERFDRTDHTEGKHLPGKTIINCQPYWWHNAINGPLG
jgi:hypothetical protein